jgi:hypothetical protein
VKRTPPPPPPCKSVRPWLEANLGKGCLAPFTGTDAKALAAAVHIIELYAYHPALSLIDAFGKVVRCMQPHCQEMAYHAIAHVMDWSNRSEIWVKAGLPEFSPRKCVHEPREGA